MQGQRHGRPWQAITHLMRTVFRALPLATSRRERLRAIAMRWVPWLRPTTMPVLTGLASRRPAVRADSPLIGHVPAVMPDRAAPASPVVAFYLPQFHPIPENDAWWGAGFTEWRNVARALPQFEGHLQPRLPADLGFYDLRRAETLRAQAELAARYGVGAFCFYFYWFGGRTLLEAPLRAWLHDRAITLPFCLCWANENWSRRWDGRPGETLIEQRHSAEDDVAFISHIAPYLRDPRYLRIDGAPVVLVYRAEQLPDAVATTGRWRRWCHEQGIGELHLACVHSFERRDPRTLGFDAAIEFPPNLADAPALTGEQHLLNPAYAGEVLDWRSLAAGYMARPPARFRLYRGVNCGWDNEARRPGRGRTWLHASPRRYRDWLHHAVATSPQGAPVFVNAWNEWAEGAILEPDAAWGHAWLEATRRALDPTPRSASKYPCVVIHAWYSDALEELLASLQRSGIDWRIVITTTPEALASVQGVLRAAGIAAEMDVYENRGRDILPFLRTANRLLDEGENLVLKLHTKRSPHRANGAMWRNELVSALLPEAGTDELIAALNADPGIGVCAPAAHLQPLKPFMGANAEAVDYLVRLSGMQPLTTDDCRFASGSMFWIRLEALRTLLEAPIPVEAFEPESGQVDGTLAHAVERLFVTCVEQAGYRVRPIGQPGVGPNQYAFADPSG